MRAAPWFLWVLGCGTQDMAVNSNYRVDTGDVGSFTPREVQLRVDVQAAELQAGGGDYRSLPQSFGRFAFDGSPLDVGTLDLRRPVLVSGTVAGHVLGPSYAGPRLPGKETSLVEAGVRIVRDDSVQDYTALTNSEGDFQLFVIPQEAYRMEVVPLDPRVPLLVQALQVESSAPQQDLNIDEGVAIFGTVTDPAGAAIPDATVSVITTDGVISTGALTDNLGRYEVRVATGETYSVACGGRAFELDPVLLSEPVDVGEVGLELDFRYPVLDWVLVDGRVEDASGSPLDRVAVSFKSSSLTGYEDIGHSTVEEVVTASGGQFIARLLAGTYTVEFLPEEGEQARDEQSPLQLDDVVIRGGTLTLPTQRLEKLLSFGGRIVSPLGDGVAQAAISCAERGFTQRVWSSRTDDGGFFDLRTSRNPVRCTLTPPGNRRDLPITTIDLNPVGHDGRLAFAQGTPVTGRVLLDGTPEDFALLEFTDEDGVRFGTVLTGSDGSFDLVLAVP